MLVKTAFNDSQVMYWEPAKYVAQAAHAEDRPEPADAQDQHGGGARRRLRPLRFPARGRLRLRVHPVPARDHEVGLDHAQELRRRPLDGGNGRSGHAGQPRDGRAAGARRARAASTWRPSSITRATVGGPALREMTFAERGAVLRAATDALQAHRNELLDLAVANGGNTRGDAKFDVDGAIFTLAAYADIGKALGATRVLVDGERHPARRAARASTASTSRCTRTGVAIHINAFNFPAWGMAEKAATALLAGMPVVSKPATSSAHGRAPDDGDPGRDQSAARRGAVAARRVLGRPARARRPLRRRGVYRLQRHRRADPRHEERDRELRAGERRGGQPERRRPRPRRRARQRDLGLLRRRTCCGT